MPVIVDASRAYVTMGEMCDACARCGASGARPPFSDFGISENLEAT